MSVTFYPEAIQYVKKEVPCYCEGHDPECYDCKGTGFFMDYVIADGFIEMNVSNMNAALILATVFPEKAHEDLCGSWDRSLQDRVAKNTLRILNKDIDKLIRNDEQYNNFYIQGVDKQRAERYLTTLLEIIHCCKKHSCNLNFA